MKVRKAHERTRVGEQFSKTLTLTEADIVAVATSLGDSNPLHFDAAHAAASRFGGIIASGPHVSGVLLALVADHFCKSGPTLGLEFNLRFAAAVHANDTLELRWEVTEITPKASLNGCIISIRGTATNQHGELVMPASGKVLLSDAV
jgi:3-hydroxybutyryl-CoA dehydratase